MAPACFNARVACSTHPKLAPRCTIAHKTSAAGLLGARLHTAGAPDRRRCQRPVTASAAAAVDAAADQWLQATGVPLLRQMQAGSLQAAAVLGAQVLVGLAAATVLGRIFLGAADRRVSGAGLPTGGLASTGGRDAGSWAARAGRYLLSSLLHQARALLPWMSSLCAATTVACLLQVTAERRPELLLRVVGEGAAGAAAAALAHVTQFLQDAAEEALVLLCTFTLLEFKTRIVERCQAVLRSGCDRTNEDAAALVAALGSAASCLIWACTALVTLANYGVNLRPLLASLGASSLVAGIAAQHLLRNVAAGITLYATRPFSLGDRVLLRAGGAVVAAGTVLAVHPTRTVIAGEAAPEHGGGHSTVFVSNGDIVETMIVENLSRVPPSSADSSGSDSS